MRLLLRSLLPDSAARLLWAGADPEGLADELAAAGHEVVTGDLPLAPPEVPGRYDALILPAGLDGDSARQLAAARALLAHEGRLVVLFSAVAPEESVRAAVVALSEAGFAILRQESAEDGRELLAARRDSFVVRGYREGDEEQILALFRASFHVDRSPVRWRWEYRENPYGAHRISQAFAPDGRLVAHYAGYPVRFYYAMSGPPRHLLALQVGDTMTAPAVRHVGRGPTSLLGRSVRHFYASYCEGHVAFNYGFNTGNIQRFSMRFVRADRLEDCPYRVREVGPAPLSLPRGLARLGWRVERVQHFDRRFDRLFRRVRDAYRLLVERDARYLEWRYATCPGTEYFLYALTRFGRLVGWSVFRQKGDRLVWGDALVDPRHRAGLGILLDRVLALPEHRETRVVEGWLSTRPAWWDETVTALGFERRPEPQGLGVVYVPFAVDPGEDFRRSLYYMWGDSDLF
ncbi:MAG TPA: GNAT family N-acetyltransferase [Thermoanaerobaculia bacterium]|nr:GNAT family N-acetyltransferase [Thermoanaerobaculia bacterium]